MTVSHRPLGWIMILLFGLLLGGPLHAQFANGWTLDTRNSNLRFQSVKNDSKVESSSFASFEGRISPDGTATLTVLLDSVDTKIDLRNVRMRFLFFETFNHPQAKITAKIDPRSIADLATLRRKSVTLPFTVDLHGVTLTFETEIIATLLDDNTVAIASTGPVTLPVTAFGLSENLAKLEEAAGGIKILPIASVTFDLVFIRNPQAVAATTVTAQPLAAVKTALETHGDFSTEACIGRFEVFSRAGNIEFASGSARLNATSFAVLDNVLDVVQRCPDLRLELAGHTDSDGSNTSNLRLSTARATTVLNYLITKGINPDRLTATGYGETTPLVPNTSANNKKRNRRIEFTVIP